MVTIHQAIKARRLALGLSQEALAAKVAKAEGRAAPLSRQTITQWESDGPDATAPKRKRLEFVAQVLGTTVERLLAGIADPPEEGQVSALPQQHVPSLDQALPVLLDALTTMALPRWPSVRAQLDQLVIHPESRDDVLGELLALLTPAPGKRPRAA